MKNSYPSLVLKTKGKRSVRVSRENKYDKYGLNSTDTVYVRFGEEYDEYFYYYVR